MGLPVGTTYGGWESYTFVVCEMESRRCADEATRDYRRNRLKVLLIAQAGFASQVSRAWAWVGWHVSFEQRRCMGSTRALAIERPVVRMGFRVKFIIAVCRCPAREQ
jgi:hypothetical protein